MNKIFNSFHKNKKGIILMMLSSVCVCFGQLFWKLFSTHDISFLILGFVLYAAGALIMLSAYRFGSLSVLQPMLSMNYVLTVVLAILVLNETLSVGRVLGISAVMAGVFLIGGGDES